MSKKAGRSTGVDIDVDEAWADLLSPGRRALLAGSGVAAGLAALGAAAPARAAQATANAAGPAARSSSGLPASQTTALQTPPPDGRSPWGYDTIHEATPAPDSVRPNEQTLPTQPRAYTDIKSYHAHVYFDEDSYKKAVQLRQWVADRFDVELGNWNQGPRGPHVTPSFYFGFVPEQLPVIVPWLQLNSLGLTILLHPNTDDPRADHLYYTLWVNRAQPVNAYDMRTPTDADGKPLIEVIYPNTRPHVAIET